MTGSLLPNVSISRRDALKLAGAVAVASLATTRLHAQPTRAKRIIVAGGGIGGLCCAYELMRRGHDVSVLEAAGRTGGHVWTIRDELVDGFYVDAGAEHITKPGYERYWDYIREFDLEVIPYPRRQDILQQIGDKFYNDAMLREPKPLEELGLNQREVRFLADHHWTDLQLLYFRPYLDNFTDEYQPLGVGLDELDEMTAAELYEKEGVSAGAARLMGVPGGSALYMIWEMAILHLRGVPLAPPDLYRLKGGNQTLPNTFAARLGERVHLGCPITHIAHGETGVTVTYREHDERKTMEAEYLVNCIPPTLLRSIPVTPKWPDDKLHVLRNIAYGSYERLYFQCRTPFWVRDGLPSTIHVNRAACHGVWQTNHEVPGPRSLLMGASSPNTTAEGALKTFREHYPGKSDTIELARVWDWSQDLWASSCERLPFPVGQLKRFWPNIMQPVGRIHFAGAYADNLTWGMEAATRSANRVAQQIDKT
jgi:monoamine oxidase